MPRLLALVIAVILSGCAQDAVTEPGGAGVRARVIRVVDGDTLKVRIGSDRETVRVLGIDTPESVKPDTPVECGAKAATRFMRGLVLTDSGQGRTVLLVADQTQGRRDRFGRLLAYVELLDGRDVSLEILTAGLAETFVFASNPLLRAAEYRAAERSAKRSGRGIWACPGD